MGLRIMANSPGVLYSDWADLSTADVVAAINSENLITHSVQSFIGPPLPPSPPLGPPNSINFSLLKLADPDPPSPAFTYIFA